MVRLAQLEAISDNCYRDRRPVTGRYIDGPQIQIFSNLPQQYYRMSMRPTATRPRIYDPFRIVQPRNDSLFYEHVVMPLRWLRSHFHRYVPGGILGLFAPRRTSRPELPLQPELRTILQRSSDTRLTGPRSTAQSDASADPMWQYREGIGVHGLVPALYRFLRIHGHSPEIDVPHLGSGESL